MRLRLGLGLYIAQQQLCRHFVSFNRLRKKGSVCCAGFCVYAIPFFYNLPIEQQYIPTLQIRKGKGKQTMFFYNQSVNVKVAVECWW